MKYLSVVVLTAGLIWTWNIIHGRTQIDADVHAGIQNKLIQIIRETLQSKKPQLQDLQILKIWTEAKGKDAVHAIFSYKFKDLDEAGSPYEQTIDGEAKLKRQADSQNEERWLLEEVKATSNNIVFSDGMIITPNMEVKAEAPAADAEKTSEH